MVAAYTIGVRALRIGAAPPPPPPPITGQTTDMAWTVGSSLVVNAGGLANNELAYTTGLLDLRADNDLTITTSNGPVAAWDSGQGLTGRFSNGTAVNQAIHSAANDTVTYSAAAANSTSGNFHACAVVRDRYVTNGGALGVMYFLLRFAGARPTWDTTIMRVGINNGGNTRESARAYILRWVGNSSVLRVIREGATSGTYQQADLSGFVADEWIALAWVLNDSRAAGVPNGASDSVSRILAKTGTAGSRPTLGVAQTAGGTAINGDGSFVADVGRSRWNNFTGVNGGANNLQIHSAGFDAAPPITNAALEANLDKLLARV